MSSTPSSAASKVPNEILCQIFEQLSDEPEALAKMGLVSPSWRALSLPILLKDVDISSHHNLITGTGRTNFHGEIENACYFRSKTTGLRTKSLISRQNDFLELIVQRPEFARYVRSLTWTLVWKDHDDPDRQFWGQQYRTWEVFGRMQNVTRLDLGSIHNIVDEPYVRQNPAKLFPSVTDLTLCGWMHRSLVTALCKGLDSGKLRSLTLDHLCDEGALLDGAPMPSHLAERHKMEEGDAYIDPAINDSLWARQEQGKAAIFPGPMWHILRLLRKCRLTSMTRLEIKLYDFSTLSRIREYVTMFDETDKFIRSTKGSLKSISVEIGEDHLLCNHQDLEGEDLDFSQDVYQPMCFDLTQSFALRLLKALTEEEYPKLEQVNLNGFGILQFTNIPGFTARRPNSGLLYLYIQRCPLVDGGFTRMRNWERRAEFYGIDYTIDYTWPELTAQDRILRNS